MGVTVREKKKGSGIYWLFINHSGSRKSKQIGSKTEATRLSKIIEGKLAGGDLGVLEDNEPAKPFSFYCRQWLDVIMPTECKESTQTDYRSIHRKHLKTAPFYNKAVGKITENDVESYLIKKKRTLARSTCQHIKDGFSNSFKRALKARIISINPCTGVTIPKDKKQRTNKLNEPFNEQEIESLLTAYKDHRLYPMILFMCRTGCRSGEVSALQWEDINFDLRKARIHQSIVRGKLVDSTKSGKDRYIDLSPFLVSELRKLKMQTQGRSEWVFQNTAGNRVDMDNFRARTWYSMLEDAELRRVRIHDLRHSYASIVISRTKDIYYAQKQLGHHSITVTVDRYGHLLNEDAATRPVDILDESQVTTGGICES